MDPILLIGSLIAISLLAGLATKLFPAKAALESHSAAVDYQRYNPDAKIETPLLSKTEDAAIIPVLEPRGQLGLVTKLGDQLVCRTLTINEPPLTSIVGNRLTLSHQDFTQPPLTLVYGEADMAKIRTLIAALIPIEGASDAV